MLRAMIPGWLVLLTGLLLLPGCPQGGLVTGDDDDATGDDDDITGDDDSTGDDDTTGPVTFAGTVDVTVDAWGVQSVGHGELEAVLDEGLLTGVGTAQFNTMGGVVQVDLVLDATEASDQVDGTLAVPLSLIAHWFDDVQMTVDGELDGDLINAQISYNDGQGITASGTMTLIAQ